MLRVPASFCVRPVWSPASLCFGKMNAGFTNLVPDRRIALHQVLSLKVCHGHCGCHILRMLSILSRHALDAYAADHDMRSHSMLSSQDDSALVSVNCSVRRNITARCGRFVLAPGMQSGVSALVGPFIILALIGRLVPCRGGMLFFQAGKPSRNQAGGISEGQVQQVAVKDSRRCGYSLLLRLCCCLSAHLRGNRAE